MLFAIPWWVNLLVLVPFASWYIWSKSGGLTISTRVLILTGLFGIAFGFMEAAVVVYLRAALGLLPGFEGTLSDVVKLSLTVYEQAQLLEKLPKSLITVALFREAATMVMLATIALVTAKRLRVWCAIFLWVFAFWDIFYYVGLWATVRWPSSLLTPDVLFLIPTPWFSQVWFPLLVSALLLVSVMLARKSYGRTEEPKNYPV